ncbi:hypothetical protein XMD509_000358 [Marinobacterium sp. xm-d-509]|nr:hypothetical protein [Marinobacterium sp. xm-g-48]NRP82112.1 hypothetical protein [Marinobacterium sp. xm-d-509]
MRKVLAILVTISLISGCQTIGRPGSKLWHNTASIEEQVQYFSSICRSYGFKEGTPEMSQCISQERMNSSNAADQRAARGAALYRSMQPRTVNCTANTMGSITNVNCR